MVGDPEGELAHRHRLGGRQAGRPKLGTGLARVASREVPQKRRSGRPRIELKEPQPENESTHDSGRAGRSSVLFEAEMGDCEIKPTPTWPIPSEMPTGPSERVARATSSKTRGRAARD